MIRLITQRWAWKILSLFAAVLIWMAVASEPEMTTIIQVPVQFRNAPKDLEISSSAIQSTVRLELQGTSGRLRSYSAQPSPVELDLSTVTGPGERTFNIDSGSIRLPREVHLDRAVPSQLRFDFERQETRSVPVRVKWVGTPPPGKKLEQVTITPSSLSIVGPRSLVDKIAYVTTDPVNLSTIREGVQVVTSPYVSEQQVRFEKFEAVRVRVTFTKADVF